ncbi:MAG: transglycosylase domain-containing protein [Acidobacteria bacterium]|nr:transglycosylase domain-containing protein [Acidobacteriota bacterium]
MNWLQRRLEHATVRRRLTAIAALLTLQSLLFTVCYIAAWLHLRKNDPRKAENLRGVSYYARPKLLFAGLEITREQLAAYLDALGYQNCAGIEAGAFYFEGDALRINARLPEFQSATIRFDGRRIRAIESDGSIVERLELEPPALLNVIRQIKDERLFSMNARRVVLSEDEAMASHLYPTTVSVEDRRFASHNGIDELGILSAVFIRRKGGGSTLVQQLVKIAVLGDVSTGWSSSGLSRKGKELFLALAACRQMTKPEIFTAYANHCPMGGGDAAGRLTLYGFGAASQELFGVEANKLTLGQAAAMAAMIHRPNHYLRAAREGNYDALLRRRAFILDAVKEQFASRYTPEMIAAAKSEPVKFLFVSEREMEKPLDLISRHFQRFAAAQALGLSEPNFRKAGNARVYLTLDPDLQAAAGRATQEHLRRLDPLVDSARRRQHVISVEADPIQAAMVVMDTQSGEILAMIGSRGDEEFNYAMAERSPGSAVKPFVYLAALAEGRLRGEPFTAATIIHPLADPVDDFRPLSHPGEIASARRNLAVSGNAAACVAARSAGLEKTRDYIEQFTGARSHDLTGMLAIGGSAGSEVSAVNLTAGYAALANGGLKLAPTAFTAVYQDGNKITQPPVTATRVAAPAPVYVLTQMLRSVAQPGGTAQRALPSAGLKNSAQIAAKTGTGQVADLWFCGYSPKLAVCVWVGMPKNKPALQIRDGFDGARGALPIWAAFIKDGVRKYRPDLLAGEFDQPPDVKTQHVDKRRGCEIDGEHSSFEFFIAGREAIPCVQMRRNR